MINSQKKVCDSRASNLISFTSFKLLLPKKKTNSHSRVAFVSLAKLKHNLFIIYLSFVKTFEFFLLVEIKNCHFDKIRKNKNEEEIMKNCKKVVFI